MAVFIDVSISLGFSLNICSVSWTFLLSQSLTEVHSLSSLSSLCISPPCKVLQSQAACSIKFSFLIFSVETKSKCCYLNMGKILLQTLVHKFDLIPSAVLGDQRLILHLWIIHRQTCGVSEVIHVCKQGRCSGAVQASPAENAKLCSIYTSRCVHPVGQACFTSKWLKTDKTWN